MQIKPDIGRTGHRLRRPSPAALALSPLLVASCCLLAVPAFAGEDIVGGIVTFSELDGDLQETPGLDSKPQKPENADWRFMLGGLAGVKPEYEGSKDYEFAYAPNYRIAWRNTVILQGKKLRVQHKGDRFVVGALVTRTGGRDEDDNNNLTGLGDVDSGWSAGGFASYRVARQVNLKAEGRQEFSGGHDGFELDLGVNFRLPLPDEKPWLRAYVGATLASDNYMGEFFSINEGQSAASGKRTFNADAGLKNITFSLSTDYDVTENWVVGAILRYDRLTGDAADSPIVTDGGSKNQFMGGVSVGYQF